MIFCGENQLIRSIDVVSADSQPDTLTFGITPEGLRVPCKVMLSTPLL